MVLANSVPPSALSLGGIQSEGLTPPHDRPSDPGHLIGQSEGDQLGRLALLEQGFGPHVQTTSSGSGVAQHGCGASDEKGAQVAIPHLRYSSEPGLSARGVLSWNQAQERCKLSTRGEHGRVGDAGGEGRSCHGTDTWNARQALTDLSDPMPFEKLPIQLRDLLLQAGQLLRERPKRCPGQGRETVILVVGEDLEQRVGDCVRREEPQGRVPPYGLEERRSSPCAGKSAAIGHDAASTRPAGPRF